MNEMMPLLARIEMLPENMSSWLEEPLDVTGSEAHPHCVRAAIAATLFAQAEKDGGAAVYLYLLDLMHLQEGLPHRERWWGVDGVIRSHDLDDEDPDSRLEFLDETRQRLNQSQRLWSVAEDVG